MLRACKACAEIDDIALKCTVAGHFRFYTHQLSDPAYPSLSTYQALQISPQPDLFFKWFSCLIKKQFQGYFLTFSWRSSHFSLPCFTSILIISFKLSFYIPFLPAITFLLLRFIISECKCFFMQICCKVLHFLAISLILSYLFNLVLSLWMTSCIYNCVLIVYIDYQAIRRSLFKMKVCFWNEIYK